MADTTERRNDGTLRAWATFRGGLATDLLRVTDFQPASRRRVGLPSSVLHRAKVSRNPVGRGSPFRDFGTGRRALKGVCALNLQNARLRAWRSRSDWAPGDSSDLHSAYDYERYRR